MDFQTVTLDDLAQRISELKVLQREYHSRQAKVAVLQRRARKLKKQLDQVRHQIDALTQGSEAHAVAAPQPTVKVKAAAKPRAAKVATPKAAAQKLADLIVEIVRAAARPIKIQALAEEVTRRKFSTTSKNIHSLVGSKVTDLVTRGVLRRAARRQGVVLRKPKAEVTATPQNRHPAGAHTKNGASAKTPTAPAMRNGQPSLQSVLTGILRITRPLISLMLNYCFSSISHLLSRVAGRTALPLFLDLSSQCATIAYALCPWHPTRTRLWHPTRTHLQRSET